MQEIQTFENIYFVLQKQPIEAAKPMDGHYLNGKAGWKLAVEAIGKVVVLQMLEVRTIKDFTSVRYFRCTNSK